MVVWLCGSSAYTAYCRAAAAGTQTWDKRSASMGMCVVVGGGGVTGNKGDQLAVAQTIVGFAKGTEEGERAKGEARLCVTG